MSSQVLDPNWGCFPLAKFSHHTGPYGAKTHTWTHVNYRTDLDFVLKEVRLVDEYGCHETRGWLKVNGGSEILESQDLTTLVQYCKGSNPSTGGEQLVELVIKSPFLAMKYPKTAQTVRRFQVKFRHETDFAHAVNILKSLGLPVVNRATPISIPPVMSPAPSVMSMSSASSARVSLPGPTSRINTGIETPRASSSASFLSPAKSEFIIPSRPESVPSDSRRMTLGLPFSNPHNIGSFPQTSTNPSPYSMPQFSRISSYHEAPSHPSIYLTQMERESQNRRLSYPAFQISDPETASNTASTSLTIPQMQAGREEVPDRLDGTSRLPIQSPFFSSQKQGSPTESATSLQNLQGQQSYFAQRPASTPAQPADVQNLWIPPRRELPFLKPRDPILAESSPILDLPPLPEPTPISKVNPVHRSASATKANSAPPAEKPAPKKRIAQRKSTSKPIEKSDSLAGVADVSKTDSSIQKDRSSPLAAKSAAVTSRPPSVALGLVSKVAASAKKRAAPTRPSSVNKRAKMIDQGTQTSRISTPSQPPQPSQHMALNLIANSPSPASPPKEFLDSLDNFITRHKARPAPKELWETPSYADTNEEQREMMLNEFIVENLGNKDFIQLCKDMEFSWRRIGLGL